MKSHASVTFIPVQVGDLMLHIHEGMFFPITESRL